MSRIEIDVSTGAQRVVECETYVDATGSPILIDVGEQLPAGLAHPSPNGSRADIVAQIATLEAKITARRLREALLSGDHSFVQGIDAQIAALRVKL